MSNEKQFIDFKKEVEKLKEIDGAEEYAKQLAHLFLGNGLSLQTILLMAIDFGQQHPHWIPVEERLPEPNYKDTSSKWVLACVNHSGVYIDSYNHKHGEWCNNHKSVTHWMPLPEAPRKEDEMDGIEIKITFEDDLAGCEITKGDNIAHFEELERSEQIQVCNSLGHFYGLFYNYIANN